ncbi:MAG TPA: 16S rRNA (adenine(1518)-N(6)/adenine(1519)-N(6))-dimethyltransferase RsmA [Steroidobacteraceae bacterium]|nr:16S rRNA (adenine(1518)-N(6)/adenine(1519)-N(6))-dimethyltransferase RsmA [Steroidobacteraceae bacterium]
MRAAGAGAPPRRKRFGQHFLHDPQVIGRILEALAARPGEHLVEIGPGLGALTAHLLALPGVSLDALEIDRDLAARLAPGFATPARRLHVGDALQFDFGALAAERGGALRVIGNLPYNISTPLLFHLAAAGPAIADLTIMLQREVVLRLAAAPGSSDYGRLTVMLAPYFDIERLFDVGPGAFRPPPRVWSAVAHLVRRAAPRFPVAPRFAQVVAAAFGQRRKTLRNALRQLLTAEAIARAGVDPGARPETLTAEAFNALAGMLDREGAAG